MSVTNDVIDVKFTDDTMSVQQQNLVKCTWIPVGCTVLARTSESSWYEPAVIKSYYADVQSLLQGYVIIFAGHTSHTRYRFMYLLLLEFTDNTGGNGGSSGGSADVYECVFIVMAVFLGSSDGR